MNVAFIVGVSAFVFGYGLGSIPFGLLMTWLAGFGDVRTIGSGNIGATNVLRTGNKWLAIATLLGDLLKGTAAVLLTKYYLGTDASLIAGLGSFLGHLFPIWLGFNGGKGIATYIGVLLAIAWMVALAFGAIWLLLAAIFRFSSLAGLVASLTTPVILYALGNPKAAILFTALTVMVWIRHRSNIARLLAGTEPKIGTKT